MMKYPKEYLEEIKLRLKVSSVVAKTVNLKKRGKEFIGLSPFKNEKTPSFTVSDEKGFYHCFSTGEHGNIFDFLMKTKSMRFGEAVKHLASEAGMQEYKFSKFDEKKEKRYQVYKNIYQDFQNYFHEKLFSSEHKNVLLYLEKRGVTKNTLKDFKIGYVDRNENFYEILKKKYNDEEIDLTGLFYKSEKSNKIVNRFHSRIIFPINNLTNDPIAFGGRIISGDKIAKYINSPETEFYKKGKILFNLDRARNFRVKSDEVIVVEGYMDVLSLYENNIKNVIANSGTAFTENQVELVWRFFSNPIISLDGDVSGQKASLRIAENIFPYISENKNIYFASLPVSTDPDDFIKKNGREEFLKLIKNKIDIKDYVWNKYLEKLNFSDPYEISRFEKYIKNLSNNIKDQTLKKYITEDYLDKLRTLTPNQNLKRSKKIFNFKQEKILKETKQILERKNNLNNLEIKELSILFMLIEFNKLSHARIEDISKISFSNKDNEGFKNEIVKLILSDNCSKEIIMEKFSISHKKLIEDIYSNSNVRLITNKKNDQEIINIIDELISDYNKEFQQKKIESFEKKLLENFDENAYSELVKLKSQINGE